jgi:stage 0 sporulation regulatory protein
VILELSKEDLTFNMMCKEMARLEAKISQTRKDLILIAKKTGLNSKDTLVFSQELDELITKYQKLKKLHNLLQTPKLLE